MRRVRTLLRDQASRRSPAVRVCRWIAGPRDFDGIFSRTARLVGVLYVAVTVPLLVGLSALLSGRVPYVFMFAVFPIVVYALPCFALVWTALVRAPSTAQDRRWYSLWHGGMVVICLTGVGMVLGLATGSRIANPLGIPAVLAIAVLLNGGIVGLTRSRSGQRAVSVDMIEAAMAVIAVAAPAVLIWGQSIVNAEEAWYTVPSGLSVIGMMFGIYWAVALVVRLGPNAGPLEICGLGITVIGAANAIAQVAQGISGFTLPAPPLMALHVACSSLFFVVPLYLRWAPLPGLDRFPPQGQIRARSLATAITLIALPVLLVANVAVDGHTAWAAPFSLGVVSVLLALAGLRQLAGNRETRDLYAQVEEASDQRRRLLAQLMLGVDEDRHRVARQLYEQSISAYTLVASLLGTYGASGPGSPSLAGATKVVRDNIARQAASRRELMLAIKPVEKDRNSTTRTLAAPIRAYLETLYEDHPAPRLVLRMDPDPDFALDWSTETIVLRIVQEALCNVWRHSEATEVDITVDILSGTISLSITDNGIGFDPAATVYGSGVTAMRAIAALLGGGIDIDSAPGAGTTIVARLGSERVDPPPPHLQLLSNVEPT
ncbi:MAG TPA: ATP-binding protein [Acidimicrobiales bacterium]